MKYITEFHSRNYVDGCIQSLMNYLDKTGVPLPTRTYDSVTIIHNALTEGV